MLCTVIFSVLQRPKRDINTVYQAIRNIDDDVALVVEKPPAVPLNKKVNAPLKLATPQEKQGDHGKLPFILRLTM